MNGERPVRVALLGCSTVGTEIVRLLREQAGELAARAGAPAALVGVAVPGTRGSGSVSEHRPSGRNGCAVPGAALLRPAQPSRRLRDGPDGCAGARAAVVDAR